MRLLPKFARRPARPCGFNLIRRLVIPRVCYSESNDPVRSPCWTARGSRRATAGQKLPPGGSFRRSPKNHCDGRCLFQTQSPAKPGTRRPEHVRRLDAVSRSLPQACLVFNLSAVGWQRKFLHAHFPCLSGRTPPFKRESASEGIARHSGDPTAHAFRAHGVTSECHCMPGNLPGFDPQLSRYAELTPQSGRAHSPVRADPPGWQGTASPTSPRSPTQECLTRRKTFWFQDDPFVGTRKRSPLML
jgi:hypothetical protein